MEFWQLIHTYFHVSIYKMDSHASFQKISLVLIGGQMFSIRSYIYSKMIMFLGKHFVYTLLLMEIIK